MDIEVLYSKVALTIMRGDQLSIIDSDLSLIPEKSENIWINIENIVFVSYRKRFSVASNDTEKERVIGSFTKDYNLVCKKFTCNWLNENDAVLLFKFGNCQDYFSSQFRQLCIDVCDATSRMHSSVVLKYIYKKLINTIIHCALYDAEPFCSILEKATMGLENIDKTDTFEYQVRFLE